MASGRTQKLHAPSVADMLLPTTVRGTPLFQTPNTSAGIPPEHSNPNRVIK